MCIRDRWKKTYMIVINCENALLDCWLLTSIDSGAELHMSWTKCITFNHILQKAFFFLLNSFWLYINKEWHLNQLASLKLLKLLVQPELEFDSAHVKWGVWNRPNRFIVLFCAPKNFTFIENHSRWKLGTSPNQPLNFNRWLTPIFIQLSLIHIWRCRRAI